MTRITELPISPTRTDAANFSVRADNFLSALPTFRNETNAVADEVEANLFAAQNASNAVLWVSGTFYEQGDVVYSPETFFSYRRKIAGFGNIDPSLDTTNWVELTGTSVALQDVQTQVADHEVRIDALEAASAGAGSNLQVLDEGGLIEENTASLNFSGEGVACVSDANGNVVVTIPANYNPKISVQDEGILKTDTIETLNFVGDAVTITNVGNDVTVSVNAISQAQFDELSNRTTGTNTGDQNTFDTVIGDTGSAQATVKDDNLTISGGVGITTSVSGKIVTITNDAPNEVQNVFSTVTANTGTTTANSPTDTLNIVGGVGINTEIVGDTLTIEYTGAGGGGASIPILDEGVEVTPVATSINFVGNDVTATSDTSGNVTVTVASQNTYSTINGNTGTTSPNTPTDTLAITGTNGASVAVSDDSVSISTNGTSSNTANTLVLRNANGEAALDHVGGTVSGLDTEIAVADGGTGQGALTLNGILYGNNTSPVNVTAAGIEGQILQAGIGGVPVFDDIDGGIY